MNIINTIDRPRNQEHQVRRRKPPSSRSRRQHLKRATEGRCVCRRITASTVRHRYHDTYSQWKCVYLSYLYVSHEYFRAFVAFSRPILIERGRTPHDQSSSFLLIKTGNSSAHLLPRAPVHISITISTCMQLVGCGANCGRHLNKACNRSSCNSRIRVSSACNMGSRS